MNEQSRGVPDDFSPGALVAGYRLEEQIGRGGMASVFRAHDGRLDRRVALKILSPGLRLDDAFSQRFIRESRAAAAVEDPHIIPVFDAGEADGVLYIAMRYVRGGDVRSLIDRLGPLAPDRVVEIISQVASALDAAHVRGLVHRDVKPANMLLERSPAEGRPDHVYLSDFGLSKTSREVSELTATGQFLGTLDYVAPEQIRSLPVDGRADQYSLACSAFEMLCGQPPFRRDESVSVMYAHLSDPPPSVRQHRPELPEQIDAALAPALAKVAADRYPTCRELATALHRAVDPGAVRNGSTSDPFSGAPSDSHPVTQVAAMTPAPRADLAARRFAQRGAATSVTRDGLTAPSAGPAQRPGGGTAQPTAARAAGADGYPVRRPWWRSPVSLAGFAAGVVLVVILAAGGAVYLASRGHTPGGTVGGGGAALAAPGCSTATANAKTLGGVRVASTHTGGHPYSVAVTRSGFDFVTTGSGVVMLKDAGSGLVQTFVRKIPAPGAGTGDTLTHNGDYLLAAAGSGAIVINAHAAEQGAANPVAGMLTSPGGSGAAEVLTTANDEFAFISLKGEVAVFNLRQALATGFGSHGYIGAVPLRGSPVGMASHGGYLYVASLKGKLSVIRLAQAETDPKHAAVTSVSAGCSPARVLLSNQGKVVWVTARDSDALLEFSAAKLQTDPRRALIAKVMVGAQPTGMTLVGQKILVADSGKSNLPTGQSTIAVVSISGKPALRGYISTGPTPHQFGNKPHSQIVFLAVQGSGDLKAVDTGTVP